MLHNFSMTDIFFRLTFINSENHSDLAFIKINILSFYSIFTALKNICTVGIGNLAHLEQVREFRLLGFLGQTFPHLIAIFSVFLSNSAVNICMGFFTSFVFMLYL